MNGRHHSKEGQWICLGFSGRPWGEGLENKGWILAAWTLSEDLDQAPKLHESMHSALEETWGCSM